MIGVSPRPSSVARRSASSPWRRPSAKAPSVAQGPRQPRPGPDPHSLYWACQTPGPPPPRSAAAARPPGRSRRWPSMPAPGYRMLAPARRCSPSSAASSRACWPAAMAPSWSPVILSTLAILASTRPSRARSSSALARASASPNRARRRPYSPSALSGRSKRGGARGPAPWCRRARAGARGPGGPARRRPPPRGTRRGRRPWRRPAGSR